MTKYTMYQKEIPPNPNKLPPHPIWRGIGCVLLVVIPFISYVMSSFLVENRDMFGWVQIPEDIVVQKLWDPYFLVKILYAAIISLALFALLALITFALNSLLGPKRYGPVDVPPEEVKRTRKSK